jgi:hypothetical protein
LVGLWKFESCWLLLFLLMVCCRCLRSVGIMMDAAAAGTSSKFRKLICESFHSPFEFNYDVWCCCLDGCCFDVPFTKECMTDSFISLCR